MRQLAVPVSSSGLILGQDFAGQPVRLHLFKEKVGAVAAIMDIGPAMVLISRSVATGVRICALTDRPGMWRQVASVLGLRDQDMDILPGNATPPDAGSFSRPLLVVRDGQAPAVSRVPPGPWRTTLVLLPEFQPQMASGLRAANIVLLGRLAHDQAITACAGLGLPLSVAQGLASLGEDMVAVVRGTEAFGVRLGMVPVEQQIAGIAQQSRVGPLA
jgi:hypothetical protein